MEGTVHFFSVFPWKLLGPQLMMAAKSQAAPVGFSSPETSNRPLPLGLTLPSPQWVLCFPLLPRDPSGRSLLRPGGLPGQTKPCPKEHNCCAAGFCCGSPEPRRSLPENGSHWYPKRGHPVPPQEPSHGVRTSEQGSALPRAIALRLPAGIAAPSSLQAARRTPWEKRQLETSGTCRDPPSISGELVPSPFPAPPPESLEKASAYQDPSC